ncbi:MAG: hypothetical protein M3256_02475 [Actinomycetota bacterium]|nr:hypothetical protein [Actinomycetota bacterium]
MGLLALMVLALGGPASLASAGSLIDATSLSAPQGGSFQMAGVVSASNSCPTGAPVQLTSSPDGGGTNLFPNGLGPQTPRDAGGNFTVTVDIPLSTPVGSYTIGLRCGGAAVGISRTLNVTAASSAAARITVSPASVKPGDAVTISGVIPTTGTMSCLAGDAVRLTSTSALFPPDGFGPNLPRDASGAFHTSYTVSSATAPAKYSIGMRCGGGTIGVGATLQVSATAPTTTTTSTTTPLTTTSSSTITTVAPATTLPETSTTFPPVPASGKSKGRGLLAVIALGVLLLVALAAVVQHFVRRGRTVPPAGPPAVPPEDSELPPPPPYEGPPRG